MRRVLVAVMAGLTLSCLPVVADAHNPTRGENSYGDDLTVSSKWGQYDDSTHSPPASTSWLQMNVSTALGTDWTADSVSHAPSFATGGSGSIPDIRYLTSAQLANTEECPAGFFVACTDYNGPASAGTTWKYTAFNSENPAGAPISLFCEYPGQADAACESIRRDALHEMGHVAGLERGDYTTGASHYQPATAPSTTTVMILNLQEASDPGWNYYLLGTCDLIELQREYDVNALSDGYANCVDHIPSPGTRYDATTDTTRIRAYAAMVDPADEVCVGEFATLSGTGVIINDPATLGRIANNPLSGRTMAIQRRTVGGSAWSAVATNGISNTGAWSKQVTSSTGGTWEYRAWYGGETAVQNDESSHFQIHWVTTGTACM